MRLALVAALALLGGAQEEPTIEEEIAALVEKTNALETLRLVYESAGDNPRTLEITYRAPDVGRVHLAMPDDDIDSWVHGRMLHLCMNGEWRRIEYPESSEARSVLDEVFPAEENLLEAGIALILSVGSGADAEVQLTYGWFPYGRSIVLGWPPFRQPQDCTRDDASIVLRKGSVTYRISRATGILESLEIDAADGPKGLTLRECALDESLDEALLTLPPEASAAALDEDASARNSSMFWASDRELGYARAHGALEERELDEAFLADWRAFSTALHRERPGRPFERALERVEQICVRLADEIRSSLALDRTPENRETWEREASERRAEIEAEVTAPDEIPAPRSVREPREELLAAEREVVAEVWRELVLTPALEAFDREVERALGE